MNIKKGGIAPCFGLQESLEGYNIHNLLKNKKLIADCIPEESQSAVKEILKKVRIEIFNWKTSEIFDGKPPLTLQKRKTILMFYKMEDAIQRSRVFDITDYYLEE